MRFIFCFFLSVMFFFSNIHGEEYYEGTATFRNYGKVDLNWLVQFLPYNPIIIEAGAYCGAETVYAAKKWPKSPLIVAFEPNPRAFEMLKKRIVEEKIENIEAYNIALNNYNGSAILHLCRGPNGNDPFFEHESSLLPPSQEMKYHCKGPEMEVPCAMLDDWCLEHHIDHIDILRLELEGNELQVLQCSSEILKNTKIIILQSFFHPYRTGTTYYFHLKDFLTKAQFVPLAHWYTQGGRGHAVYVSQELFDAYFVKCLGLGLGGLLYP
ncbi:MAG TPA: FkbM family methyltransferase [Rhabdochlamydiaceae bacterium]|nr:FkbM family methyltransferase [Rhabdochlamydiaceae bacterium]